MALYMEQMNKDKEILLVLNGTDFNTITSALIKAGCKDRDLLDTLSEIAEEANEAQPRADHTRHVHHTRL